MAEDAAGPRENNNDLNTVTAPGNDSQQELNNPEQQALNLSDEDFTNLRKLLVEHNLPLVCPVLIVEVLVNQQLQSDLDQDTQKKKFTFGEEDLREVFSGFGRVTDVELSDTDECAYITFQDFFEAWFAQQSLNGYYVADYRVNLLVKWLPGPT